MLYWSLPATEERSTRAPHEDGSLQPGEPRNKDATAPDQHILFHIIFDCNATHTTDKLKPYLWTMGNDKIGALNDVSTHLFIIVGKFVFTIKYYIHLKISIILSKIMSGCHDCVCVC